MLKIIAAVAALAITSPAFADYILKGEFRAPCGALPPKAVRQEPAVPYTIFTLPQAKVQKWCAAGRKAYQPITACAAPQGSGAWTIVVSDFLSPTDLACVLLYEKAHLPPNNWQDQAWEDQGFKGTPYTKRQSAPLTH